MPEPKKAGIGHMLQHLERNDEERVGDRASGTKRSPRKTRSQDELRVR